MNPLQLTVEKLAKDISLTIRPICENDISDKKSWLVIKTANDIVFDQMVDFMIDRLPDISITVLGEFREDVDIESRKHIDNVIPYAGRFNVEASVNYSNIIKDNHFDAIIFLNYSLHKESYLNVEDFISSLNEEGLLKTYVYVIPDKKIYEYTDLKLHCLQLATYVDTLKLLDYEQRKELG